MTENLKKSLFFLCLSVFTLQQVYSLDDINANRDKKTYRKNFRSHRMFEADNKKPLWYKKPLFKVALVTSAVVTTAFICTRNHVRDPESFSLHNTDGSLSNNLASSSLASPSYLNQMIDLFVNSATGILIQQAIDWINPFQGSLITKTEVVHSFERDKPSSEFDVSDYIQHQKELDHPDLSPNFIEVRSVKDVARVLGDVSLLRDTIILIDADYTVITPEDRFGQPQDQILWQEKITKNLIERKVPMGQRFMKGETYTEKSVYEEVIQIIMRGMAYKLIDPEWAALAKKLIDNNVDLFVLTGLGFPLEDGLAWRARMFEHDLNFPLTRLPISDPIYWHEEGSNVTTGYARGVIKSGKQSKGDALLHFMDHIIKHRYKNVIFIDNAEKFLKSVATMCSKESISYKGLMWIWEPFNEKIDSNEEVTEFQGTTLISTGEFFPYEEALRIVNSRKLRLT